MLLICINRSGFQKCLRFEDKPKAVRGIKTTNLLRFVFDFYMLKFLFCLSYSVEFIIMRFVCVCDALLNG